MSVIIYETYNDTFMHQLFNIETKYLNKKYTEKIRLKSHDNFI